MERVIRAAVGRVSVVPAPAWVGIENTVWDGIVDVAGPDILCIIVLGDVCCLSLGRLARACRRTVDPANVWL